MSDDNVKLQVLGEPGTIVRAEAVRDIQRHIIATTVALWATRSHYCPSIDGEDPAIMGSYHQTAVGIAEKWAESLDSGDGQKTTAPPE